MPFVFVIVGIVFVTSGVRGSSADLVTLLENDFLGPNNFSYWVISIAIIGALGYVQAMRGFSRALLALVLVVLILAANKQGAAGGGLFTQFQSAVKQITGG